MTFAKWAFRIAGISGLLILLPQYFLETYNGEKHPPAITHPEYYYGFIGVAVAWQVAFLMISRDPVRFRPLMLAAIIEKASFGLAAIALYLAGRLNTEMLGAGLLDLAFGAAFAFAYVKTDAASRRESAPPAESGQMSGPSPFGHRPANRPTSSA